MKYNSCFFFINTTFILFLISCGPNTDQGKYKIKYKQYVNEGYRLYIQHCSNCHQKDGTGLARLYPPLKDSNYLMNDPDSIICIIKNGQKGEIFVNNISFNQPMPENLVLTNLEIAEITTFLYSEWGETKHFLSPQEIEEILSLCP